MQVDQFRQNIEVTRANLLDQTNALELAVDNYKTQILGLPSDLPAEVDEQLVEGFQLIPVESNPVVDAILELQTRIGDIGELQDLAIRVDDLEKSLADLADQDIDEIELFLLQLQAIVDAVARRVKYLPNDLTLLRQALSSKDESSKRRSLSRIESDARKQSWRIGSYPATQARISRLNSLAILTRLARLSTPRALSNSAWPR